MIGGLVDLSRDHPRTPDHQRYAQDLLVQSCVARGRGMADPAAFRQLLRVIGGENDQRITQHFAAFDVRPEAAEPGVELSHVAFIERADRGTIAQWKSIGAGWQCGQAHERRHALACRTVAGGQHSLPVGHELRIRMIRKMNLNVVIPEHVRLLLQQVIGQPADVILIIFNRNAQISVLIRAHESLRAGDGPPFVGQPLERYLPSPGPLVLYGIGARVNALFKGRQSGDDGNDVGCSPCRDRAMLRIAPTAECCLPQTRH